MVSEVSKKYKIKNKKRKKENKDVLQKNKKLKPLKNLEPPKNDGATDNLAEEVPLVRNSDDPIIPKVKWTNKQRLLIFACKGINAKDKKVMVDLQRLLPHAKKELNKTGKTNMDTINEIVKLENCNKCLYFVAKKHKDLYMWMSNGSDGPSAKFLVENHHTMNEIRLTGNCLVGSRPLLCFDQNFDEAPHWVLLKEIISHIFNVPLGHPKSQPFFDKVFVFSLNKNKIFFRNYQIVEEDGQLTEIGPRFIMNPIKIFEGSFAGSVLWGNPSYVSPNQNRRTVKEEKAFKSFNKMCQKREKMLRMNKVRTEIIGDPTTEFFHTKPPEEAVGREKNLFIRKKVVEKKRK